MRTTEERMRLIYRRTQELKREKQRKRQRYAAALCLAASFCLTAGLGFWVSSPSDAAIAPKTADTHQTVLWLILMMSAVIGLTGTVIRNRKKKSAD